METSEAKVLQICEQSEINETRRQAVEMALYAGLENNARNNLAILCTELGTNLLKHTESGGQLIVQTLIDGEIPGVEVYSIDSGKGMNTKLCMVDGYSSTGTLGTGLGAVQRLAHQFSIYSSEETGTIIQTQIWNSADKIQSNYDVGGVCIPKPGELLSGDKYAAIINDRGICCFVVDGLGHGVEAAEAAVLAVKRFKETLALSPREQLASIHSALRGSRGAVGAIARIDRAARTVTYCGLGNIEGIISDGLSSKHLVSLNGTLGYEARKITEFVLPWTAETILVMHSDGLSSRTAESLTEVQNEPASLIAGWLYKQNTKHTDDATVLVIKDAKPNKKKS